MTCTLVSTVCVSHRVVDAAPVQQDVCAHECQHQSVCAQIYTNNVRAPTQTHTHSGHVRRLLIGCPLHLLSLMPSFLIFFEPVKVVPATLAESDAGVIAASARPSSTRISSLLVEGFHANATQVVFAKP